MSVITDILNALGQGLRNIFSSGFLALASLILLLSSLVSLTSCMLPFWFQLTLVNQTFEVSDIPVDVTINTGLFFMYESDMINLLMIDKATSVQLMPDFLHWAQFLFLIGTIGIFICTASAILLSLRDKTVVSAEMALTGATTALALCQVFGVLFCLFQVSFDDKAMWQDLPVKDSVPNRFGFYKVLKAFPILKLHWGFYLGCITAFFCIAAAVMLWLQMCMSCIKLTNRRYQMLREKPDDGASPIPGYPYYANKGYMIHPGEVVF